MGRVARQFFSGALHRMCVRLPTFEFVPAPPPGRHYGIFFSFRDLWNLQHPSVSLRHNSGLIHIRPHRPRTMQLWGRDRHTFRTATMTTATFFSGCRWSSSLFLRWSSSHSSLQVDSRSAAASMSDNGAPVAVRFSVFNSTSLHCNLVITLILGAKRNERHNETSVMTKCIFWVTYNAQ